MNNADKESTRGPCSKISAQIHWQSCVTPDTAQQKNLSSLVRVSVYFVLDPLASLCSNSDWFCVCSNETAPGEFEVTTTGHAFHE